MLRIAQQWHGRHFPYRRTCIRLDCHSVPVRLASLRVDLTQASKRQRGLKGRASDPLLYGANATRSPIVTRKKSGVLKPDPASKIGYASGTAASETRVSASGRTILSPVSLISQHTPHPLAVPQ